MNGVGEWATENVRISQYPTLWSQAGCVTATSPLSVRVVVRCPGCTLEQAHTSIIKSHHRILMFLYIPSIVEDNFIMISKFGY